MCRLSTHFIRLSLFPSGSLGRGQLHGLELDACGQQTATDDDVAAEPVHEWLRHSVRTNYSGRSYMIEHSYEIWLPNLPHNCLRIRKKKIPELSPFFFSWVLLNGLYFWWCLCLILIWNRHLWGVNWTDIWRLTILPILKLQIQLWFEILKPKI